MLQCAQYFHPVVDADDMQAFYLQAVELTAQCGIAAIIGDSPYLMSLRLQVANDFARPTGMSRPLTGNTIYDSAHCITPLASDAQMIVVYCDKNIAVARNGHQLCW